MFKAASIGYIDFIFKNLKKEKMKYMILVLLFILTLNSIYSCLQELLPELITQIISFSDPLSQNEYRTIRNSCANNVFNNVATELQKNFTVNIFDYFDLITLYYHVFEKKYHPCLTHPFLLTNKYLSDCVTSFYAEKNLLKPLLFLGNKKVDASTFFTVAMRI